MTKERYKRLLNVGLVISIIVGLIMIALLPKPVEATESNCLDGIDNDQDGYTDDDDSDCGVVPPPNEINCTDGIDNDVDGLIDAADPDCTTLPPPSNCPAWYHVQGTVCVPDSPTQGMTLANQNLNTPWEGAYYDDGKWRIMITNPWLDQRSPPAPSSVEYLTRWVAPNGVIYSDQISSFRVENIVPIHSDIHDEMTLPGGIVAHGEWHVYVFVTTGNLQYVEIDNKLVANYSGLTLQALGSDVFTATPQQDSILNLFCLAVPICG